MNIGLILGDQLHSELASLRILDKSKDRIVMAEVAAEATYVPHHQQKIALLFSAMRHFAETLRTAGWQVTYHKYNPDSQCQSLLDVVKRECQEHAPEKLILTQCGEYRLQHSIDIDWPDALGIPVTVYEDDRFFCNAQTFNDWAKDRKELRMEFFYREMRRKTGYLMKDNKPEGDAWNFDADNRKRWKGDPPLPTPPIFSRDDIDEDVFNLVKQHFNHHIGNLDNFAWATTRDQALEALSFFIEQALPYFGDYQDALAKGESCLFHSLLSPYINCGLLTPKEVCDAVIEAYQQESIPLNSAEGFIRQIIGWREYVRGIYWLTMPNYAGQNYFNNERELPKYYWDGDTKMSCMADCFSNTINHAYAHHIQRLMVTGNFALLTGIAPQEICDWYLAVYADAYEWVELPNTLGMVMHADGGYLGSKPYAASGNYINKMSDHCKGCHYDVKTRSESDSCPFNSLYWHFLNRHRDLLEKNPRMGLIYRSFDKLGEEEQNKVIARAGGLLSQLDAL
ncbi:MAG: cryptochrome/photolyase family protein [Oleibacter sp.]|nr:cryptochrome/photolyase family protein [Thalassolituus sp.]